MHRFPNGSRLNFSGIEVGNQIVARTAEAVFVNEKTAQPVGRHAVSGFGHGRDSRKFGEGVAILPRDGPALLHTEVEHLELAASDAREDIAHAVVIAGFGMFVSK